MARRPIGPEAGGLLGEALDALLAQNAQRTSASSAAVMNISVARPKMEVALMRAPPRVLLDRPTQCRPQR